ncbi:MAG: acyl-protein synthetase [Magnetococcales bacterium]|nr:acyl-protein synthetase [Magnetococcales bacterium]MBF0156060.1 acyl-protein synthetase [Magnetococcales bacterium]
MTPTDPVDALLARPPYAVSPTEKEALLLPLLVERIGAAALASAEYGHFVRHWPCPLAEATSIDDLPLLPVASFKREPPLQTVPSATLLRTLTSSATTGQQPSRIALDAGTARRMSRSLVVILKDFIGPERRPCGIVDAASVNAASTALSARGAAVRGLTPFATSMTYFCDQDAGGGLVIRNEEILNWAESQRGKPVLLYGFTFALWQALVRQRRFASLGLEQATVIHSGGWKKLWELAVSKAEFNCEVAAAVGCDPGRVIDYYGMVENVGVVYPDCPKGNKHAPVFGEVIVRDPLTMRRVGGGGSGILQVCSLLPTSFPGHALLTEDLAAVVSEDGCPCGRRGVAFRFLGRIRKAEVRGCGNIATARMLPGDI